MKVSGAVLTVLWTRCAFPSPQPVGSKTLHILLQKISVQEIKQCEATCLCGLQWNDFCSHDWCVWPLTFCELEGRDCLCLSADLHLCSCSQSPLKKMNVSTRVIGYCTGLASLRFWAWELLFCAPISWSAAFSLLWDPRSPLKPFLWIVSHPSTHVGHCLHHAARWGNCMCWELEQPEWLPYAFS